MKYTFLRAAIRVACPGLLAFGMAAQLALAQAPEAIDPLEPAPPLDDITQRQVISERQPLAWAPVRESDILWERRIWRVIDVREKMNQPFVCPESPLFEAISEAALKGDLPLYSTEDDHFAKRLSADDLHAVFFHRDTVLRYDMDSGDEELVVVENTLNWEDVKRFRIKESWWFDSNLGTLRVRILGIAPLLDVKDEEGNFRYEQPLFWVHYPSARPVLAQQKAYTHGGNLASTMTWEDIFEMRYFASAVYKENNLYDRRLQDYLTGTDMLTEAGKINDDIFNREQDAWSW